MCRACFKFTSSAKGNSLADAGHVNVTICSCQAHRHTHFHHSKHLLYADVQLIHMIHSNSVIIMSLSYCIHSCYCMMCAPVHICLHGLKCICIWVHVRVSRVEHVCILKAGHVFETMHVPEHIASVYLHVLNPERLFACVCVYQEPSMVYVFQVLSVSVHVFACVCASVCTHRVCTHQVLRMHVQVFAHIKLKCWVYTCKSTNYVTGVIMVKYIYILGNSTIIYSWYIHKIFDLRTQNKINYFVNLMKWAQTGGSRDWDRPFLTFGGSDRQGCIGECWKLCETVS
jgi:hypothetical protein